MSKYTVQRPRHLAEIQRVDEQGRGLDLPAGVGAHWPSASDTLRFRSEKKLTGGTDRA
jgi:hypothetical protein